MQQREELETRLKGIQRHLNSIANRTSEEYGVPRTCSPQKRSPHIRPTQPTRLGQHSSKMEFPEVCPPSSTMPLTDESLRDLEVNLSANNIQQEDISRIDFHIASSTPSHHLYEGTPSNGPLLLPGNVILPMHCDLEIFPNSSHIERLQGGIRLGYTNDSSLITTAQQSPHPGPEFPVFGCINTNFEAEENVFFVPIPYESHPCWSDGLKRGLLPCPVQDADILYSLDGSHGEPQPLTVKDTKASATCTEFTLDVSTASLFNTTFRIAEASVGSLERDLSVSHLSQVSSANSAEAHDFTSLADYLDFEEKWLESLDYLNQETIPVQDNYDECNSLLDSNATFDIVENSWQHMTSDQDVDIDSLLAAYLA